MSVSIARLRALAAQKGLRVERHEWRDCIRLVCRNGAELAHYTYARKKTGFRYGHAARFLTGLPDQD